MSGSRFQEPTDLVARLGERLRLALDARGWRCEDFAQRIAALGFEWTGNTVTQVIAGRRALPLLELAGICEALGEPLTTLVDPETQLGLPSGDVVTLDAVLSALVGAQGAWMADAVALGRMRETRAEEVTYKAAVRLGVDQATIEAAAQELWGRSLAAEREARLPAGSDATDPIARRALQARRGHATRVLIGELRAHFGEQP